MKDMVPKGMVLPLASGVEVEEAEMITWTSTQPMRTKMLSAAAVWRRRRRLRWD